MLKKGLFITFEGIEGCGKSTQIKLLSEYLNSRGFKTIIFWEPGATKIGEDIRKILLSLSNKNMSDICELLLYLAARSQLVHEKIIPAIKQKKIIICDRFYDSTFAYQGYAAGGNLKIIERLNNFVIGRIKPDLTILLDIEARTGLARCKKNDRIEQKKIEFHEAVRIGFLKIAKRDPKRIKVVPVNGDINSVQQDIRNIVDKYLS